MDGSGFSGNNDLGVPNGSRSAYDNSKKRLQESQAQVNEVVGIMRVNVEKVLERDSKLTELDNRADALSQGASQFEQHANRLKRKMWWKNVKMMIIMGVIGGVFLIIFIVAMHQPRKKTMPSDVQQYPFHSELLMDSFGF